MVGPFRKRTAADDVRRVLKHHKLPVRVTQDADYPERVQFVAENRAQFYFYRIIQPHEEMPVGHPQVNCLDDCSGNLFGSYSATPCRGVCRCGWTITHPRHDFTVVQSAVVDRIVTFNRPGDQQAYPDRFTTDCFAVDLDAQFLIKPDLDMLGWFVTTLLGKTEHFVGVRDRWSEIV
jgi:hypothetical protein